MIVKKALLLLFLPVMVNMIVACCNCLDSVVLLYTYKEFSVSNLDNSGAQPREITTGAVPKAAYGLRMQIAAEEVVRLDNPVSLFGQAAYARYTKCRCGGDTYYHPRDTITSINVITLNNFNSSHPAGADVSAYFKILESYSLSTISEYLKKAQDNLFNDGLYDKKLLDLLLMTAPDAAGAYKFRVQVVVSDGRILEQDTPTIDLQ